MNPTDEELLHAFYAGDNAAIDLMVERHNALLWHVAFLILKTRTGSAVQALGEWDIRERVANVWIHVLLTQQAAIGPWPHQRLSALTLADPYPMPGNGSTLGAARTVLNGAKGSEFAFRRTTHECRSQT